MQPLVVEAALRVPLVLLWNMLLIRTMLYSWNLTTRPQTQRVEGWAWFRVGVVSMGVGVAYLYSPPSLLLHVGLIGRAAADWMIVAGNVCNLVSVIAFLTGLDVSTSGTARAFPTYAGITILAPLLLVLI